MRVRRELNSDKTAHTEPSQAEQSRTEQREAQQRNSSVLFCSTTSICVVLFLVLWTFARFWLLLSSLLCVDLINIFTLYCVCVFFSSVEIHCWMHSQIKVNNSFSKSYTLNGSNVHISTVARAACISTTYFISRLLAYLYAHRMLRTHTLCVIFHLERMCS